MTNTDLTTSPATTMFKVFYTYKGKPYFERLQAVTAEVAGTRFAALAKESGRTVEVTKVEVLVASPKKAPAKKTAAPKVGVPGMSAGTQALMRKYGLA